MKIGVIPEFELFDSDKNPSLKPYEELREYFYKNNSQFDIIDNLKVNDYDYFLFFKLEWKLLFKLLLQKKLDKTIYIQLEPPAVISYHESKKIKRISKFFGKILTWNDEIVDKKKFFKFYIPMPNNKYEVNVLFENKKLLCNISSGYKFSKNLNELYSKRIEAIKFFEKKCLKDFDLYGVGWEKKEFPSSKEKINNKNEVLKNYKFSICYENQRNIKGYVTEKIFDCFYAKTIPIYWGADNIENYIPRDCYIDKREFKTYEELYEYINNMSEEEYNRKIKNIEKYLKSESYSKFLGKEFAKIIYEVIMNEKTKKINYLQASYILFFTAFFMSFYNSLRKVKFYIKNTIK